MNPRNLLVAAQPRLCVSVLASILLPALLGGQHAAPPPGQDGTSSPGQTSPSSAKEGAALFSRSGCPFCHGPQGIGTDKAPNIHDVWKRKTDEEIFQQIHDGGKMMPPFADALTENEIRSLVMFLRAEDGWQMLPASSSKS